mmetsp:Transcript_19728/g.41220  ORF Transcript_19728/g.41220 Transcript_19728/m.41220 type:complete len:494 (-) Transcript_19728:74-1555(-)
MVGFDGDSKGQEGEAGTYAWREQRGKSVWVPTAMKETRRDGSPLPKYTMEEIGRHNKPDDLWLVVDNRVYDVSKWAKHHPGGHLCMENVAGADATDAFENYHPAYVYESKLPRFLIGTVTNYKDCDFVAEFRTMRQRLLAEGKFETDMSFYVAQFMWGASLMFMGFYLVLSFQSFWAHMLGAVFFGALFQQIAFIGHDIGHNGISHIKSVDNIVSIFIANLIGGISMGWWKWSHNVHHVITNSVEHDPDIQHLPIFAVTKKIFRPFFSTFHNKVMSLDSAARALVSIQHYLYYPVMALARFNLYAQSYILLFSNETWPYKWLEWPCIMLYPVWFGYFLSFLPSWTEIVLFLLISHSLAGILHVQITLSHFSMDTYYGRKKFDSHEDNWFKMQLDTSMDVASNHLTEWFHGGLQYQIEHHLFPRLPRHNLKYAAALVKEFAEKHGVRYHRPGFIQANREIIAALAKAAREVKDAPNGKEAFKNSMLWDGMNARG